MVEASSAQTGRAEPSLVGIVRRYGGSREVRDGLGKSAETGRGRRAAGRGFGGGPKKCGELRGCPKNDVLEPPKMTKREAPTSQPVLGAFPI